MLVLSSTGIERPMLTIENRWHFSRLSSNMLIPAVMDAPTGMLPIQTRCQSLPDLFNSVVPSGMGVRDSKLAIETSMHSQVHTIVKSAQTIRSRQPETYASHRGTTTLPSRVVIQSTTFTRHNLTETYACYWDTLSISFCDVCPVCNFHHGWEL